MRRIALGVLVMSAVLVAGCGSSDTAQDSSADAAGSSALLQPDDVLEAYVEAMGPLATLGQSTGDPSSELREVADALGPLGGSIAVDGIEGVPESISYDAGIATGSLAVSIDLVVDCIDGGAVGCDPFIDGLTEKSREVGAAMAEIVPYSSWTRDELLTRLEMLR